MQRTRSVMCVCVITMCVISGPAHAQNPSGPTTFPPEPSPCCNANLLDSDGRVLLERGTIITPTTAVFNIIKVRVSGTIQCNTWASYQIRKIAGCACTGNAGNGFPRRRFQRKLLVNDPGMHHGTSVTRVPWCMPGSPTCGDGVNVPDACAIRNFTYLARGPLRPGQNVHHFTDHILKSFILIKTFVYWLKLHWSLFLRDPLKRASIGSDNGLAPNRGQAIIWTNGAID